MCLFLESICCDNGKHQNLDLHQERVNRTFQSFFKTEPFILSEGLNEIPEKGRYKCRVVYGKEIESIEFLPYAIPKINSLKIVEIEGLDYDFKFLDRNNLDIAFQKRSNMDDVIIIKDGYVTDAYYANLAFFDGNIWFTPTNPLLKGTKRQALLKSGVLIEKEINTQNIRQYQKVSLINAMLELSVVEVDVKQIF